MRRVSARAHQRLRDIVSGMLTLFLSHRQSADSRAVGAAAESAGWPVVRLRSYVVPDELSGAGGVFYGESLFADAVCDQLGVNLLEPDVGWLPNLPEAHRLRNVELTTYAAAASDSRRRFVKPADEKSFAPGVYESGAALSRQVDPGTPVLSAEPVSFVVEFRAFVCKREVAALSPYIRAGELESDASDVEWAGARDALSRLLANPAVELPPGVVVDVGLVEGRGWAVVEANPAWGSGICACEPDGVLRTLLAACPPSVGNDTRRWLRSL